LNLCTIVLLKHCNTHPKLVYTQHLLTIRKQKKKTLIITLQRAVLPDVLCQACGIF